MTILKNLFRKFFIITARVFAKKIWKHLDVLLETIGRRQNLSITYAVRELGIENVGVVRRSNFATAIIVQGPIRDPIFVTKNLLRYRRRFPDVEVVLSTWTNDVIDEDLLSKSNIHLVRNELPLYSGIGNINLQIASTNAGLQKASSLNCKRIIKSRTDQTFFASDAIVYFESMFAFYNANKANKSILVPSHGSLLFRLYSMSDQFQYGDIGTLLDFWSLELSKISSPPWAKGSGEYPGLSRPKWSENGDQFAEEYLITSMLVNKNIIPNYTLQQSLETYRDFFCVFNERDIDLVWDKGSKKELFNRSKSRDNLRTKEMSAWEWQLLIKDFEFFLANSRDELEKFIGFENLQK